MPCVQPDPDHVRVLDLFALGEPVPEDLATVVEELRRWGWVMPGADELTERRVEPCRGDREGSVGLRSPWRS
jgi:hypothetical protein